MPATGRERFGRQCDLLVHGGIVLLLIFSPLAFGAVHAWPLAIVEALSAFLLMVWAAKLLVCGSTDEANRRVRRWGAPLLCFGAVVLLELLPLPPPVLRLVSPHTYSLYRDNLPGWPEQAAFDELSRTVSALRASQARPPQLGPLPSVSATDAVAASALAPEVTRVERLAGRLSPSAAWRPLSIYRYRTGAELLRMAALSAVFFCSSATPGSVRLRTGSVPG